MFILTVIDEYQTGEILLRGVSNPKEASKLTDTPRSIVFFS